MQTGTTCLTFGFHWRHWYFLINIGVSGFLFIYLFLLFLLFLLLHDGSTITKNISHSSRTFLKLTTVSPYGGWVPGPTTRSTAPMAGNPHIPAMSPHTLPRHPSHWISQWKNKEGWSHWRSQQRNKEREGGVVDTRPAPTTKWHHHTTQHSTLTIPVVLSQHCVEHLTWLKTAEHLLYHTTVCC